MAQQLFNLARRPAIAELLAPGTPDDDQRAGRLLDHDLHDRLGCGRDRFRHLGDRIGRVKTMVLTILLYSIFTGLSYFSRTIWDFNAYRFLCSLGVGGQFAVGVALVAEVMPARSRPYALGLLQALSTVATCSRRSLEFGSGS